MIMPLKALLVFCRYIQFGHCFFFGWPCCFDFIGASFSHDISFILMSHFGIGSLKLLFRCLDFVIQSFDLLPVLVLRDKVLLHI